MGSVHDPVGVTVASTGNVVQKAGDTVTSAGELVSGLGTEKLSPLAPLTTPVGGAVQKLGMAVSHGGDKLGDALSTGPVAQLTGTTSKVIVPLTTKLTDTTQAVGAATTWERRGTACCPRWAIPSRPEAGCWRTAMPREYPVWAASSRKRAIPLPLPAGSCMAILTATAATRLVAC
ncbi:hypothetical protein AWV80_00500 [Cupriavidus sp. UYMU48A]|nr:hypothetical protein AWV80_00500 [Cupriavidus sp. UYMU48A]